MDPLVTTDWLTSHLDDPDLVVLDATVELRRRDGGGFDMITGRDDHDAGHIPGARFADLIEDLSDTTSPLRFALPSPEEFCAAVGALGVGDDARVVLYDRAGSMWAARVWWMLRWVGFDRAALLDGGWTAWSAEGRPVSTETTDPVAATLTPRVRPRLVADRDEVLAAVGENSVCLIDSLDAAQYRGETRNYGRPGHIPGASNAPAMTLVDRSGRFRPLEELADRFPADREARTIAYCGGGIAASANAFTMTRLGHSDVAVYTASLQEWAADPANPLETSG